MRTRNSFWAPELGGVARVVALAWLLSFFFFPASAQDARKDSAEGTADSVALGRALYARHCARCHGFGMVSSGTVTYDLRRFPHNDKARFVNSVINGKGNMPPWKGTLSEEQVDLLWAYVLTGGKR